MYDRSNRPMPCKNFCYGGVLGVPEPPSGRYGAGCDGHTKGEPCTVSKGVGLYFFHPDQAEWAFVPGVNKTSKMAAAVAQEDETSLPENETANEENVVSAELVEAILPVLVDSFISAVRNKTPLPPNPFPPSQFVFLAKSKHSSASSNSNHDARSKFNSKHRHPTSEKEDSRRIKRRKSVSR